MTQPPLFDRTSFQPSSFDNLDIIAAQKVLTGEAFDVRQRSYESGQTFVQRQIASAYALSVDYNDQQKWCSIKDWVDIAPKGRGERLPSHIGRYQPHECYYLEIKAIQPSDWQTPHHLKAWNTQNLPARATYIPHLNDVFLSRFKEPPGKCIIFLAETSLPIYVSSNFIPLRAKPGYSPFALLAFLKSSFGLCQLNKIILRRTTTAEMYIYNTPQIAVPQLPSELQKVLHTYGQSMVEAEQTYRRFSISNKECGDTNETYSNAVRLLNELPVKIDALIRHYIEQK